MFRKLRERLDETLRTDSDFEAFCLDFFPDVRRRFSGGMDRVAKTSLLLQVLPRPEVIAQRLDQIAGVRPADGAPATPGSQADGSATRRDAMSPPETNGAANELSLERVKAACARVVVLHRGHTLRQGTGYLVRPDRLVTCSHVVRPAPPDATILVAFAEGGQKQEATVEQFDDKTDWAILTLRDPQRDRVPLQRVTSAIAEARWLTFGYPESMGPHGLVLAGVVRDPRGKDDQGIEAVQLFCEDAAAARGALLGGASGAPVLSGGRLIGHVRRVSPDESDRSQLGLVYACPSRAYEAALSPLLGMAGPLSRSPQAAYDPLWYIPRRDAELLALNKLREVGAPVTLQAPEGYGKGWMVQHLLSRIAQEDAAKGQRTEVIRFNLRKAASPPPATLDELLMAVLRASLEQLGIERVEALVAQAGKGLGDAKRKFRRALEKHVLSRPAERCLLLIEESDHLHGAPVETDFFTVLRAMAEDRTPIYRGLRLIVTIGAEAGFLETTDHSAFFGLSAPIVLDGFSLAQLRTEAMLHGLHEDDAGLRELHRLTAGHPFYSRLAMHEASCAEKTLAQMLASVDERGGLFASGLQRLRGYLDREGLAPTLKAILQSPRCTVASDLYLKLYRKGLVVETTPGEYRVRCPLFETYFRALYR